MRGYRESESQRMTQNQRINRSSWADHWGVSEKQIEEAIEQTGENNPAAVKEYLQKHNYLKTEKI